MALVPEDARAELDRERLETCEAAIPPRAVEVPEDVKAEFDAEARKLAETAGNDAQRPVQLDELAELHDR